MKLLTMKTGEHQCMLYSLAMLLDVSPDVLIDEIGHNGSELWFPGYREPYCLRGYHIQEMVDVCLAHGKAMVPIELFPRSASAMAPTVGKLLWPNPKAVERFTSMITSRNGLLIGRTVKGDGHACAWDGEKVYDPNGRIYHLENFQVQECWILLDVPSHQ